MAVVSISRPVAGPAKFTGNQFALNQLPQRTAIGSGVRVTGLPSPSVGTLQPVTRTVPPRPSPGGGLGTPSVLASFGQAAYAPVSLPRPVSPIQNHIGEKQ